MIPLFLQLRVPRTKKTPVNLFIPVFPVWIIVLCLVLLLSPVLILAGLLQRLHGRRPSAILIIHVIAVMMWHLRGLTVDVSTSDTDFFFKFI